MVVSQLLGRCFTKTKHTLFRRARCSYSVMKTVRDVQEEALNQNVEQNRVNDQATTAASTQKMFISSMALAERRDPDKLTDTDDSAKKLARWGFSHLKPPPVDTKRPDLFDTKRADLFKRLNFNTTPGLSPVEAQKERHARMMEECRRNREEREK